MLGADGVGQLAEGRIVVLAGLPLKGSPGYSWVLVPHHYAEWGHECPVKEL
jgi:hypothetical protein